METVVFRKEQDGEIVAVFPQTKANEYCDYYTLNEGYVVNGYCCNETINYVNTEATKEEYQLLKDVMEKDLECKFKVVKQTNKI